MIDPLKGGLFLIHTLYNNGRCGQMILYEFMADVSGGGVGEGGGPPPLERTSGGWKVGRGGTSIST